MGKEFAENNGGIIEIVATENGNNGGSTASTSSTYTRTDTGGSNGGRTDGGTADGGTTKTKEKDNLGLALLTEEEQKQYSVADDKEKKRLLRNAKRRERYAKQKADNGESVKPRKVNKKATAKKDDIDRTQINNVITSLSGVIASRPNCSHWQLSNEEVDTITKPLCEMLKESEVFTKVAEHSNEIALVTACLTVFAPRVVTTVLIQKELAKNERKRNTTNQKTEDKKLDKRNDKGTTNQHSSTSDNGSWYGNALY